jgi:hypothetical protein
LNDDGICDGFDIDLLSLAIREGSELTGFFDVDGDGDVNSADQDTLVRESLQTYFGDANLDGEFTSSDMVQVFEGGKYGLDAYATWANGDWNADLIFDSADLVKAFIDGGYERGPRLAAKGVPEPTHSISGLVAVFFVIVVAQPRRK